AWAEGAVLAAVVRSLAAGTGGPSRIGGAAGRPSAEYGAGSATAECPAPGGGWARATVDVDESGWPVGVAVDVEAGDPLDETVLRSYVTGAAHMALGWVCSE